MRYNERTEAGQATLLDAYANTAVKRRGDAGPAKVREPADEPPPSPLAMHRLKEKKVMYQRHFALTRLPFETPEQTDELFDSASRLRGRGAPERI